jgi:hypothetical protein
MAKGKIVMSHLALAGGPRQRGDKKWPDWPIRGAEERALVDEVVAKGPWSYEGAHRDELAGLEVEKPRTASVAAPRRGIPTA